MISSQIWSFQLNVAGYAVRFLDLDPENERESGSCTLGCGLTNDARSCSEDVS